MELGLRLLCSRLPRRDMVSGFLVFLVALPLSLGIAMASGFPPVAGVLTAIVGGVLVSFLGSAPLTIKGPAAGLIVVVVGAVQELGAGDIAAGYRRTLAVGVVAALAQIVMALAGAASLGAAMPPSVVHGMLAAIGVIIVAKQSHVVLDVAPHGDSPLELLGELPRSLAHENPEILLIGVVSLLILFALPLMARRLRWVASVPAPMVVVAAAVPLGLLFDLEHHHTYTFGGAVHEVGPRHLVNLPGRFVDALALPDFSVVFSLASLKYAVMFTLVGSIESTLSVLAVDAMDPQRRASNLDRDLLAVGLGNLVASAIGGLPMISEIVRSRSNLDAGARGPASNFFHGLFLLAFVALAPALLHRIPLAALAAMLVYTGFRLASPSELRHAHQLGLDQLAFFLTTLLVTLAADLLVGVAAGLALKIALHAYRGGGLRRLLGAKVELRREGEHLTLVLHESATFAALLKVRRLLRAVPPDVTEVVVDVRDTRLVDHTFLERLHAMSAEWPAATLRVVGLEALRPASGHPRATRWGVGS
ncbi:MAG: SulP family inorganic anion transporter [Sandaracinaceae bacterium]|nr:MAG: SulP family inorganic anion transporter [Sandaracinaceae bacterium]